MPRRNKKQRNLTKRQREERLRVKREEEIQVRLACDFIVEF